MVLCFYTHQSRCANRLRRKENEVRIFGSCRTEQHPGPGWPNLHRQHVCRRNLPGNRRGCQRLPRDDFGASQNYRGSAERATQQRCQCGRGTHVLQLKLKVPFCSQHWGLFSIPQYSVLAKIITLPYN
jgi:hypothetical protein